VPAKSKKQQAFLFAAEKRGAVKPGTAEEFAVSGKAFQKLPEKVKKKK
jgi:hypothetical protein